jgi:DNA-binding IclR family transcriptional regulator
MEPGNLNHRWRICLRHTLLCPGIRGGEAFIQCAHAYLETIDEKTKLSAFLRLPSDYRAILIDKVDSGLRDLVGRRH